MPGARCPEDGTSTAVGAPVAYAPPPSHVGAHEVGELLGRGGFSSVYQSDALAIKLAHDNTASTRARFEREAHALTTIGAPFVPSLVESGTLDDGRPYLVMELVAGETLAHRLASTTVAPSIREACALAIAILDSLAAVRSHELAHRDLKPENIILTADGSARLIDFGLVRDCNDDVLLTRAGTILGTTEYMAPEQFRGAHSDLSVDIYAFGVVLYELLTGRPPFIGGRAAIEHGHRHMRPPCPSLSRPMSESLETLILSCLAKEPERRPANLSALREQLVHEHETAIERPSSPSIPTRPAPKQDNTRPVVLLYLAGAPADELGLLLEQSRARVARQRGDDVVLVFLGAEHERPLEAALAIANEATRRWDCRGAVHIGRALVRRTAGRIHVFGRDVERPASWIPETPWHGVVLTPLATEALGRRAIAARELPLVARDGELAAIRSTIDDAMRTAKPRCCVLVGEGGVGKSALASVLARSSYETLLISCTRPVAGDSEHSLRQLIRYLLGDDDDTITCDRNHVRRAVLAGLQRRAAAAPLLVVLDDAQFADDLTLEILERACEVEGNALAVVMTCTPRFPIANRANRRSLQVIELHPLDGSSAAILARHLLPAGTRVSTSVLQHLAQWSAGNPGVLTQLVNVLLRERIIRRHEGTNAWFVAADELDRMPTSPAVEWVARRELDTLSPELGELAQICAVLGSELCLDELEAVQRGLETDGYDRPMVDAAAGLSMLVEHGLVVEGVSGYFSFRRGALQEALYAVAPSETRTAVHRAAFVYWRDRGEDGDALFRLAHHGARGGFTDEARVHYATIAARAKARHAYHEAERMLTAAIDLCAADDVLALYQMFEDRGSVRRLLTHYEGARRDFARARELAEQIGDPAKVVAVLVAEAAVCDFTQEWDAQARLMQTAQDVRPEVLPPRVEARYRNWLGVARARQGLDDDAIALLGDAMTMGAAIDDHETEVGSGLLLGYLLFIAGRREAGLHILQGTITRCERVGDWFHLVIGLNNRIILCKLTDSQGQAEADCQRAIAISHEHGYHQLEIWGLHNLSTTRWWGGNFTGALAAAQLAYEVSVERFGSKSSHRERLHCAMHLVAHGRGAEVHAMLEGVREQELESTPIDCATLTALRLALHGSTSERAWRDVIERTREVGDDCDFVEVLWLRARAALQAGDRVAARKAFRDAYDEAVACDAPVAKALLAEQRALVTRSFPNAHEAPAQ